MRLFVGVHAQLWPIFRTSSKIFLSHQSCDSTTELLDPSTIPSIFLEGSHAQPSAGIHTKVAQVVALSLGCPLDVIRVADTNSEALRPTKRREGLVEGWRSIMMLHACYVSCCLTMSRLKNHNTISFGSLSNDTTVTGKNCTKFSWHPKVTWNPPMKLDFPMFLNSPNPSWPGGAKCTIHWWIHYHRSRLRSSKTGGEIQVWEN